MKMFFSIEEFKAARVKKGLSQEKLAAAACVSTSTVAAIETGRNKRPSIATIAAITAALGVEFTTFFLPTAPPVVSKKPKKKRHK